MRWGLRDFMLNRQWGMPAFGLQRLTGLGLVFYMFLHFFVLSHAWRQGPAGYERFVTGFSGLLPRMAEYLLLAGVVLHGLNGVRIILVDFLGLTRQHRSILAVVTGVGIVIMLAAIPVFFGEFIGGHELP
jgi:succinate dehydrogenase / fumarate reductase cytochrome b subunit